MKIGIVGAGSIGNHLAYACRFFDLNVSVFDIDEKALTRMKTQIYPERYGYWDKEIILNSIDSLWHISDFDIIFIGTPPDTHFNLANRILMENRPKLLMIEKPLIDPDINKLWNLNKVIAESHIKVGVGYNHSVSESFDFFIKQISTLDPHLITSISSFTLESWQGILNAHPWIATPYDTYLGYLKRGGGSLSEHSHGLHLWVYTAMQLGLFESCNFDSEIDLDEERKSYDTRTRIVVSKSNKYFGEICMDVVSNPSIKKITVNTDREVITWGIESKDVEYVSVNSKKRIFVKNRKMDFINEIKHLKECLLGDKFENSPLNIKFAEITQRIIIKVLEKNNLINPQK